MASKIYKLTAGDERIFRLASDPNNKVGVNYFTSYYFGGRELRPWQWAVHHAAQSQITVVGGVGSGKTVGAGMSYASWAAMTPNFKYMNLAPTSWQSRLQYEAILREAQGKPFEDFIYKAIERPYPLIVLKNSYIGESTLEFMSAADSAERIQGWEGDAMNLDEAGILHDALWLMIMMVTRTRGNVPIAGTRQFRDRLKRMTVITANYEFAPAWLWERMDMMFKKPSHFLSMQVKSSDNLSQEDIENYKLIIPEDKLAQMLEGQKPEGVAVHFTPDQVKACEDWELNRMAQEELLEKATPNTNWKVIEKQGAGCVKFEMPSSARSGVPYVLIGDPGTANPPHRNAGCVTVWDVAGFPNKPATLRYFDWVYGNGSYDPFKYSYHYAYQKYRPEISIIDDTGPQKLWSEQILFNLGIYSTGFDFSGQKMGMLTAAELLIQRGMVRYPFIQGIRSQLVSYDIAEDKLNSKLPQDIVVNIFMLAFYLRKYLFMDVAEKQKPTQPIIEPSVRGNGRGAHRIGVRKRSRRRYVSTYR